MANLDLLALVPGGNASLSVVERDGNMITIHNLNIDIIGRQCPLLEFSFEQGASGIPRASIEAASVDLVVHFLRFLYTGDYLSYDSMGALPFSLFMHAQLCRMAEVFEVPVLQALAHTNIIRETELACSLPSPPLDLCPAIRFIYEHLVDQRPLVDTVLHYCVNCFLQHGLASSNSFRQVAFELQPFHRDLCRTSLMRGFQDDGAIDIVRLPVRQSTPHSMQDLSKLALGDFLYGLWPGDISETPREVEPESCRTSPEAENRLAFRPKLGDRGKIELPEDEPNGYTLVHLPRLVSHPQSSVQNDADHQQQERLEDWTIPMSSTASDTSSSDSEWAFV